MDTTSKKMKMEDNLKKNENGRRPQFFLNRRRLTYFDTGRRPQFFEDERPPLFYLYGRRPTKMQF